MENKGLNNPALITAIASNPELVDSLKKTTKKTVSVARIAGLTALGAGVTYVGYRSYISYQRKKFLDENSSDPNVQLALLLHKAMIGDLSGKSLLSFISPFALLASFIPNGTDEKLVFSTLKKTKDFSTVSKMYQKISGRNLQRDLQSELDGEEYKKALALIDLDKTFKKVSTQKYEEFKPFVKGDKIIVTNPNGAQIYSYKIVDGVYVKGPIMTTVSQGTEFTIHHTLNNSDRTRIHYKICNGFTSWGYCLTGDALINHRDVKKN